MRLYTRNVNSAFSTLVASFNEGEKCKDFDWRAPGDKLPIVTEESRNGRCFVLDEPILITYGQPTERVLFNEGRDANPFFHLYEALWMLAGRNDVESLDYYCSKVKQYSDDGKSFNGAYGYRWRNHIIHHMTAYEKVDQIEVLVNHLRSDPNSRRAVLRMWNVEDDLMKIGTLDDKGSKDVCCNLDVMFRIRKVTRKVEPTRIFRKGEQVGHGTDTMFDSVLDMTVVNRSNDMILGMLGANYVHFTMLQEYMAAKIGVGVGKYHHMTNNLHAYEWNWEPSKWDEDLYTDYPSPDQLIPLVKDAKTFDQELPLFVDMHKNGNAVNYMGAGRTKWKEPFFAQVAHPMMCAFHCHKTRKYDEALPWLGLDGELADGLCPIRDKAWAMAAESWITKRKHNYLRDKGDE